MSISRKVQYITKDHLTSVVSNLVHEFEEAAGSCFGASVDAGLLLEDVLRLNGYSDDEIYQVLR